MESLIHQILAVLRDVFRYRWMAFALAWGVCLVAWPIVLTLPNKYEARARVFVDPTTALRPVIQGLAIEQDLNAELNLVRQSLLSRSHLQKIVAQAGLASKPLWPAAEARLLNDLGQRIDIEVAPQPTAADNPVPSKVYTITFDDNDRDRSLKVVQILLNSFMEGTIGGKRKDSAEAQKFVEGQIKEYEAKLSEAEQRLADFKKRNVGMVPGDREGGDYFTRLQNEIDAEKKARTTLEIAITRRAALAEQLRGEAPVAASTQPMTAAGGAGARGGDTLSRIQETQAKLDDMLLRFTDKHPDVIALRQTLADLKERRAAELEALKRGDAGAAVATGASANPVYQSIQLQLNQADVEIAGLRGELGDHQAKITALRRMVDTQPQVEAEFARLNRDYAVNKAQYTALVDRLEKARLGGEAEATGAVRFEIIDPPTADPNPIWPKRSMLLATVLLAALGAGIAVAYLMTLIKPVFHSAKELMERTGVAVLGVISVTHVAGNPISRRRQLLLYSLACSTFLVGLMVVVFVGRSFAPLPFGLARN
jgi:polysaccharide chain length determinant protein (PEP-CTERM system associated)